MQGATPAPARILDVGGATGVHADALSRSGYEVVMIDPVESQVRVAAQYGTFVAQVGDARHLDFANDSFDAVLLAGPLYHLVERQERLQALAEALRVCRPGGVVHAAAIPRFTAFAIAAFNRDVLDAAPEAWLDLLRNGTQVPGLRFPAGHFHTVDELHDEMTAVGLHNVSVVGLEGPAGLALEAAQHVSDSDYMAAHQLAQTYSSTCDCWRYMAACVGASWRFS